MLLLTLGGTLSGDPRVVQTDPCRSVRVRVVVAWFHDPPHIGLRSCPQDSSQGNLAVRMRPAAGPCILFRRQSHLDSLAARRHPEDEPGPALILILKV